ncbi:MAG: hypothetical protein EXS10_03395 [Phycisphaerales bacterium]|nr:hypothetical protein [Phycisphaerales bacterium]
MADKPDKSGSKETKGGSAKDAVAGDAAPAKKGGMKFMAITAGLLVVEGAAIVGFFSMTGPKHVEAEVPVMIANPEESKPIELLLLDDRLVNDRTGLAYLYEVEVYVKVRKKDEVWVKEEIERSRNELRAEIGGLWRTAEPHHFQEPTFETLTRRIEGVLRERFDHRSADGKPTVDRCVLVVGTGIRINR